MELSNKRLAISSRPTSFASVLLRTITRPAIRFRVRREIALLLAIMLCALLIRLLWLDADAAPTLTWSGAPYTDEGLYSHAARNRVLFGTWRTDGWDNRLVSPLFDALAYVVYSTFGVGYVPLRMISVAFAIIALPLFFDLLRPAVGSGWALLAAALWSCDYFWFQYSRLGLLEPSMVTWLVAAAWCFGRGVRRPESGIRWMIACGACAGIGYVWKSLALVFVPVPLLALLLVERRSWRNVGGYLIGLAMVVVAYVVLWYVPNAAELTRYNRFYAADRVPPGIAAAWHSFGQNIRSPYIVGQTPIILGVSLLGLGPALGCWRRVPAPILLCVMWITCGATLLIMPYSPPRYYTLLLPPLIALAVYACQQLHTVVSVRLSRVAITLFVGACMIWNGWWYVRWAGTRQWTLINSSRAIAALVPPGEMVLGVSACGLSLANTLPCAPPFAGLANDDRPVEALRARYAVVDSRPDDYLRHFHPSLLARSRVIDRFALGPRRVTLYQLPVNNDQ